MKFPQNGVHFAVCDEYMLITLNFTHCIHEDAVMITSMTILFILQLLLKWYDAYLINLCGLIKGNATVSKE